MGDWHGLTFLVDAIEMVRQVNPELKALEKLQLIQSMRECQQTAILQRAYICRDIKKRLVQDEGLQHIFIGKETYDDEDDTISIAGNIPPFVIKNIIAISESGIWQWWVNLLGKSELDDITESDEVKAATMSGNIVIIFIVWSSGIVLTSLCFIIERCKRTNFVNSSGVKSSSPKQPASQRKLGETDIQEDSVFVKVPEQLDSCKTDNHRLM